MVPLEQDVTQTHSLFNLYRPKGKVRGVVAIPHAGEWVPSEFKPYLTNNLRDMLEDVDFQVPALIHAEELLDQGVIIIVANVHRVAVDLNRPEDKSVLHWEFNTKGVRLRIKDIPPTEEEFLRIKYHRPYFEVLKDILQNLEQDYPKEKIPVIDLHSMPSKPTDYHLRLNPNQKMTRADFCLSDLKGLSCDPGYIEAIHNSFSNLGYCPIINDPYFGGYGTQFAHNFRTNVIQIEINRELYMDEEKKVLIPEKVVNLKKDLTQTLIKNFNQALR